MKIQNVQIFLALFILFISQVYSDANTFEELVHENAQFPKAYTLNNKHVLVISSVIGENKCLVSEYDEDGETVYADMPLNISDSGSAQMVCVNENAIIFGHNKQNLARSIPYDTITRIKQGRYVSSKAVPKSHFYLQKSAVSLKCGNVLMAGITGGATNNVVTDIDVNLYDPQTDTYGNGISFGGYGKLVSCYEQKENQVYCAYVSQQYPFVAKLKLQLIEVNPTAKTLTSKGEQVIKTFYTEFNYLKAVPFNENEAIILFRVGNGEKLPRYGNSGKDLLYYHIKLSSEEGLVSGVRYDKLNDGAQNIGYCRFRKNDEDSSIDIGVLSKNRIYIACEDENGRFKGFIIYPGKEKIDEFYFNNFDAQEVRNPFFAKFDKTLGIFYTYINENNNYNVNFHLMNYPDCRDYYENKVYLIPRYRSKDDLDFYGKVFMNNAYPASRQNEKINIKFEPFSNISIINTYNNPETNIEAGIEYDPEKLYLKIIPQGIEGTYSIEYTATRQDNLDGLIEGKTCKINFKTPKCLEQCYSCADEGTDEKNECLDCKNVSYYREDYENATDRGYGKPHNCKRCNESCYDCYGPFELEPITTTNCKRCDYDNGYYHFIGNKKTCISYATKKYWEEVIGHALYLNKTAGENKKNLWTWEFCHDNCETCSGPGTDEDNQCDTCKADLHFFCNQTKGHGIPGSCHADCENNGFYLKDSEGMKKCCPCLDGCKECVDEHSCIDCYKPLYLGPNNDSCVEDCGYCYAKDNTTFRAWQCVNCKTRYEDGERYNLNGTCYKEIPFITYKDPYFTGKNKKHHVLDDTCNWLIGCKGGCFNCSHWYTEQCTNKCLPGYYKEDFYSLTPKETFPCFTEDECHGISKYEFDILMEIGGVAKIINGEGVCYNCKLREGNYRQVENNFTCGPKPKRTYINITNYNKLSQCYTRCASCKRWGNSCKHNCLSCRDPSLYFLDHYPVDQPEGDCKRITHKCKGLPYYHDYDLAAKLGVDEDSCGQDCDVCLENRTCTANYPFYVAATRECVEVCGFQEIMSKNCTMEQPNAIGIFMNNPFDLPDTYEYLNKTSIETIITQSIIEKYALQMNIDITVLKQNIYNYIGKGKPFNLPSSEIILGNNNSIQLTTNKLEEETLKKIEKEEIRQTVTTTTTKTINTTKTTTITETTEKENSTTQDTTKTIEKEKPTNEDTTASTNSITDKNEEKTKEDDLVPIINVEKPPILDISECEKILKKEFNLPENEELLIIKGSNFKEFEQYFGNDVNFLLFSTSLLRILPLDKCINVPTLVTDIFNAGNLKELSFQKKVDAGTKNGYNIFNINSKFYNDVCTPFTSEYGTDVSLDDRQGYYPENLNICKDGCTFVNYSAILNTYTCECPTGNIGKNGKEETELITKSIDRTQYKNHTHSNIEVIKCVSQTFSSKGLKNNFGFYSLLACFTSFIGVVVSYAVKYSRNLDKIIISNPPIKSGSKTEDSGADSHRKSQQVDHHNPDDTKNDYDYINAKYEDALENKEQRTFLQNYLTFLKLKQMFIFTFFTTLDRNLKVVKIGLFILFVSFYFAFTALFFNDSIMRKIYEYKGNTDAAVHVPNIILSSLCCIVMNILVKFVSLSERDMYKIRNENKKEEKDKIKGKIKIKTYILFGVSIALILFFWYYVSAFCAVFKNSQVHYLINVIGAFIVCNIWPFVTSFIPLILRNIALSKESPCLYKASQIAFYI